MIKWEVAVIEGLVEDEAFLACQLCNAHEPLAHVSLRMQMHMQMHMNMQMHMDMQMHMNMHVRADRCGGMTRAYLSS